MADAVVEPVTAEEPPQEAPSAAPAGEAEDAPAAAEAAAPSDPEAAAPADGSAEAPPSTEEPAAAATAAEAAPTQHDENGLKRERAETEDNAEDCPAAKRVNNEGAPDAGPGDDPPADPPAGGLAAGQVTEVIQVPNVLVGKLIGKAGATIKDIQTRGQAHLTIEHTVEGGETKPVSITGTPEAVAATKKLVQEALDTNAPASEGEDSRTVQCPPHIVGRIIGRGGETIRSLQTASNAHIVINQNFPEGQPREIEIKGKPDSVECAYNMVMEIINSDGAAQPQALISKFGQGVTRTVMCPKHMVGRVIGRGGETVKGLQRQFGATVQIDQNATPCTVTITGNPQAVTAAERAVMDLIEDRGPGGHHHGPPGGFGGYGPPPYGGYGPGPYGPPPFMGFAPPPYGGYGGYGPPHAGYPGYPPQAGAYGGYGAPGFGAPAYGAGYGAPDASAWGAQAAADYGGAAAGAAAAQQQQQQQPQQQAAAQGAAAGSAASAWQELKDGEGRSYYYNSTTGVSQWEKPAGMA